MKMKRIFFFLALILSATLLSAQPMVTNSSAGESLEISLGRNVIFLQPSEQKSIWFLPEEGVAQGVRFRYAVGEEVKSSFVSDFTLVKGSKNLTPLTASRNSRTPTVKSQTQTPVDSQQKGVTPDFSPTIPQVEANATIKNIMLVLNNSSGHKILVFDGDFRGASLSNNGKTDPTGTKPGIISMNILYDSEPDSSSTGKKLCQCQIRGIVTQNQKEFVITAEHIKELPGNRVKVLFLNPSDFNMISDNPAEAPSIKAHNRTRRPVKLNEGFNNVSYSYYNAFGVKVTAVYEIAVIEGRTVITLNPNTFGNFYGVAK